MTANVLMSAAEFESWLRARHYAESTIRVTVTGSALALKAATGSTPVKLHPNARVSIRRYLAFVDDTNAALAPVLRKRLEELMTKKPVQLGGHVGKQKRKRKASAHEDDDWARLARALVEHDDIEARVLTVVVATGLRIGDLLRLPVEELRRGLREGVITVVAKGDREHLQPVEGAGGAWERLDTWIREHQRPAPKNIAGAVCPKNDSPLAGDCAYQRVNRYLKELCRDLGVEGRIHIHRMRRTVIMQALRVTKDIHAVMKLANHRDLRTTMAYTDEPMPERVGELQKQIREKFGGPR